MKRAICITAVLVLLALGSGCAGSSKQIAGEAPPQEDVELLSPEQARSALIRLIGRLDKADLKMGLPSLKSNDILNIGPGKIAIGKWVCNLNRYTFVVCIDAGEIFAEYSGVFRLVDGKWNAVIERELHGHKDK